MHAHLALLTLFIFTALGVSAQPGSTPESYGYIDSARAENNWRRDVHPGERFQVQLSRTFMLTQGQPDTFPINGAQSGTYSAGVSLNLLAAKSLRVRIQPMVSVERLVFSQSAKKTFPTPRDSLLNEKLRAIYIENPLGLAYVISKEDKPYNYKTLSFIELGIAPGYLLDGSYKRGLRVDGKRAKLKVPARDPLNRLRLGVYARITYRFLGLYGYYRISSFYKPDYRDAQGRIYPQVARWEIGLSILL